MLFFEGFVWAVPTFFSEAVAKCKFEEGDLLYSDKSAYEPWTRAFSGSLSAITVKHPRRTLRVTKGDMASVVAANWHSEVRLELCDPMAAGSPNILTTTQGAVIHVLWKGEIRWLHGDPPPLPLFLKDVTQNKQKRLHEAEPRCRILARGRPHFIMACDPTNDVSQRKHRAVLTALQDRFGCEFFSLSPKESGFSDWERIFPVVRTHLYVVREAAPDEIQTALKKALYKPSADSQKDGFQIHRHGILRG